MGLGIKIHRIPRVALILSHLIPLCAQVYRLTPNLTLSQHICQITLGFSLAKNVYSMNFPPSPKAIRAPVHSQQAETDHNINIPIDKALRCYLHLVVVEGL